MAAAFAHRLVKCTVGALLLVVAKLYTDAVAAPVQHLLATPLGEDFSACLSVRRQAVATKYYVQTYGALDYNLEQLCRIDSVFFFSHQRAIPTGILYDSRLEYN